MQGWYAIYCKPHCERQVENKLVADGIETYYPVLPVAAPRKGRPAFRAFFPCYLFVRVDLDAVGISRLNWTPGARHLVMFGGIPSAIHEAVIERIREHLAQPHAMDTQGEILAHGDRVRITSGPLSDVDAMFDKRLSAQGRVRVLVQLLQRWTPVEVDATILKKQSPFKSTRRPALARGGR